MPLCHLTLPGRLSASSPMQSTLDVTLEGTARAFLRKLEAAGGRLFLETDDDRRQSQACLRQDLAGPAGPDRRCVSISPKGRAYLARLRSAE
ncbi:hypothetical protein [Pararhizobium sp. DWP3-4]|uniref:hypothetical protein n=1 Tax=Pararhizobium sp. DWP3-4 TaxID=2804565 RepID=UPI003CF66077